MSPHFHDEPATPREDDAPMSSAAAGRVLGMYLRDLRQQRKLRLVDVVAAGVVGSPATLSRIEKATTPAGAETIVGLLHHYGRADKRTRDKMLALLRESRGPSWRDEFSDVIPGWLDRLMSVESYASKIRTYQQQFIPGLLQTPDYARALLASEPKPPGPLHTPETVGRAAALRTMRQTVLHRPNPPSYTAMIDQAVLYRPVGGARVLEEQMRHLLGMTQPGSGISVRIYPTSAWALATPPGRSITLLDFASGHEEEMVYLEGTRGGTYLNGSAEVTRYKAWLTGMFKYATKRGETLKLLSKRLRELEGD